MDKVNIRNLVLGLFKDQDKKPDFSNYLALYDKGSFREAYNVLQDIVKRYPKYSKVGDIYVEYADLELFVNDNVQKAFEFLRKAHDLGCHFMDQYYSRYGYVLWRMGKHEKGIEYCEKSVELVPTGRNLTTLGKLLSMNNDKRAADIWKRF